MSNEEFLCVRCARHMRTCCQTADVFVTLGDVRRIQNHAGVDNFYEYRGVADPAYADQDDDPLWRDGVFRADGSRRVVKKSATNDCTFLGEQGCRLPLEIRPLICRIYPFDYTEAGLLDDLAPGCPRELLAPGADLIESLAMNAEDARRWHRQLYQEIREEMGLPLQQSPLHIGLTYDLRTEYLAAGYDEEETAEFDSLATIEAIERGLQQLGHQVERIGHARDLVSRLANGQRWDGVFNICEGLRGAGREAQVPAILDAYDIPYTFSDPLVMSLCLHKGLTKTIVERVGIPTPRFAVVEHPEDFAAVNVGYPAFVKPVAEGTGKGITPISRVTSSLELTRVGTDLLRRFRQPVLVEAFLPGREFTVGLLGTGANARVLGTLEIILRPAAESQVYSYVNKEQCEELVEYRHVRAEADPEVARAEQIALRAWRELGCRDGGRIDLRSDATGQPQFLEANPLAGLHPTHSDLPMLATAVGLSYVDLLGHILESAIARWGIHESRRSPQPAI